MDTIWVELVLIVFGVALNGFFAASEIALVSSRLSRLAQLGRTSPAAAAALRLKEHPDAFLATIQIGITLVGTLTSAIGGAAAVEALTPPLVSAGLGRAAQPTALGVVVVAIAYLSLVLGELAPKAIALRDPERLAIFVAPPILALSRVSTRLVRILTTSTNVVLRLMGLGTPSESRFVSEEDVRFLVREGAAKGIFEKTEEELVHNVFEFADTTVREVMVPRPNIRGIDVTTPPAAVPRRVAEIGHSRIPVYRGDISHPAGILLMRDALRACAEGRTPPIAEMLRPPLFVPETTKISGVLRTLQRQRQDMALVVDEYGNVVGLITIRDIVEEIVGDIRDEGDSSVSQIVRLPDGALLVDGLTPVDEIRAMGVPVEDSLDYTTAGGFVITALGAIPAPGATVTVAGYRWRVLEMDGPRVRRIRIERAAEDRPAA
jgi:putative hemolysin